MIIRAVTSSGACASACDVGRVQRVLSMVLNFPTVIARSSLFFPQLSLSSHDVPLKYEEESSPLKKGTGEHLRPT